MGVKLAKLNKDNPDFKKNDLKKVTATHLKTIFCLRPELSDHKSVRSFNVKKILKYNQKTKMSRMLKQKTLKCVK